MKKYFELFLVEQEPPKRFWSFKSSHKLNEFIKVPNAGYNLLRECVNFPYSPIFSECFPEFPKKLGCVNITKEIPSIFEIWVRWGWIA